MAVCFLFLGWAFWELSGGSEFEPAVTRTAVADVTATTLDESPAEEVEVVASEPVAPETDTTEPETTEIAAVDPAPEQTPESVLTTELNNALDSAIEETAQETAALAEEVVPQPVAAPIDLRRVSGDRVNMRQGPGTNFGIVTRLTQGDEVEVIQEPGNGWLELRVVESNKIGWIADWLVTGG
ncbi:SH3 domain-containing protein [Pseudaestuariivita sp.]|uniref:SH3 domain-containing protein n=1 Tax=Pseudaestuariivita sp. TaxID=2211669 RepID=UPI00405A216B